MQNKPLECKQTGSFDRKKFYLSLSVYSLQKFDLVLNLCCLEMAFYFLSQLNQNAEYEVEDEDRSSPVDEEEGENEESDIELDPEDARARGNGNCANANLDLDSDTEEGASAEPDNKFAWSSELHDVEIEMFTQNTGPLFLLNMFDSMQTKYNTQKSTRKPKNDQKTCIMRTKNVFSLEMMTFENFFPTFLIKNMIHVIYGLKKYPILFLNNIFP